MSTSTMLSARLLAPGHVELERVPVPRPAFGEVIVRVEAALTCGTDIKTWRRGHPKIPLPIAMGHEAAGVISWVGDGVRGFKPGDPVAYAPTAPCGICRLCKRGQESLCADAVGRMVFGAFSEYVLLPEHIVRTNLFQRPSSLSAEEAAGLEPLAAVLHGADRVGLQRAEHVVLVGDGPIALLFLQVARDRGAGRVLLAGKHPVRLDAARVLGADRIVDLGKEDLESAVAEWTGGIGADVAVECVGTPETWELTARLTATGGEALLYGGCAGGARASFDTYRVHYEEVDLKGAFHYGRTDVRRALGLLASGAVRMAPLITHRLPLSRLDEALQLVVSREAIKVALIP